jgi:hypothetical protein
LGVTSYFWYYAPLVPAFIISSGVGIEFLLNHLVRAFPSRQRIISILTGIFILCLSLTIASHSALQSKQIDERYSIYKAIGKWIRMNTDSQDKIGSLEVGIIGYYAERNMVDYSGLIQPEIAEVLKQSSTYETSILWGTQRYKPDYIIVNPDMFLKFMEEVIDPNCEVCSIFLGKKYDYGSNLSIYQCIWKESKIDYASFK